MKLLRTSKRGLVFQLGRLERQLLLKTLEFYPLVPVSHHRLSSKDDQLQADENQRLLVESLAEQRRENRRQIQAMIERPQRFRETKDGCEFTLTPVEIEWLLQVLNDVRVGSWLALGEPEQGEEPEVTEENANYLLMLEVSGMFQSFLLAALGVSESPEWAG